MIQKFFHFAIILIFYCFLLLDEVFERTKGNSPVVDAQNDVVPQKQVFSQSASIKVLD